MIPSRRAVGQRRAPPAERTRIKVWQSNVARQSHIPRTELNVPHERHTEDDITMIQENENLSKVRQQPLVEIICKKFEYGIRKQEFNFGSIYVHIDPIVTRYVHKEESGNDGDDEADYLVVTG